MSLLATERVEKMVVIQCCHDGCEMHFGMPESFYRNRKEDHNNWYCPRGHRQYFSGKSDTEKLQDRINELELQKINLNQVIGNKNQRIEQLNYSVRAQKAAKTKILNRVKNGVCPCCNRNFANLQNHFKTKHPELMEV